MRIALNILLALLPFLLYGGWLHLTDRSPFLRESWKQKPVAWLSILGAILFAAGLLAMQAERQYDPNAEYVPARIENGVLIPGHIGKPPQAPAK